MRIIPQPISRFWLAMPELVRFLLVNCLIGIAAGWIFLGLLLATDTASLRTLIWTSATPGIALTLLATGFAMTFGSLAMGTAIMSLPKGGEGDS